MTTSGLAVPSEWDEISPAWMTAAIADHFPGAQVDAVEVALRDDGTNRRARLKLAYSTGTGPATVFAKAVDPAHAELVALTSGLFHEPRLFSSGVSLPLEHPEVYAAVYDEDTSNFLMIMEDVTARGADPRDSTRPLTVDQAASGVRGLARLHSNYWGDLLEEYRAALALPADEMPSSEELLLRYRASVAHGLAIWIATLSGGDAWQRPDISLAFAQRYSAAFVDLETRSALDAIC